MLDNATVPLIPNPNNHRAYYAKAISQEKKFCYIVIAVTILYGLFVFTYKSDREEVSDYSVVFTPHRIADLVESSEQIKEIKNLERKIDEFLSTTPDFTVEGFQSKNVIYGLVPSLKYLAGNLKTVMRHRLAACTIEKNMSTVIAAIMCFLEGPVEFRKANRTITKETWATRFCMDKNEYPSLERLTDATATMRKDWYIYTIVRDPLERIISAFIDKCIQNSENRPLKGLCYNCKEDIRCFIDTVYGRAMRFARNEIPRENITMEDWHTFPQHWFCGLSDIEGNDLTVLRFSSDPEQRNRTYKGLVKIYKERHVETELIAEVLDQVVNGNTIHTTVTSPEKQKYTKMVTEDKAMMRTIYRMYYHDYRMFDFPFNYDVMD